MNIQNLVRVLDWLVATRTRLALTLTVLTAIMVGGLLTTTVPWRLRDQQINAFAEEIDAAAALAFTTEQKWGAIDQWYVDAYSVEFATSFGRVDAQLVAARTQLELAKSISGPDGAVAAIRVGQTGLDTTEQLLRSASTVVDTAVAEKGEARSLYNAAQVRITELAANKASAEKDFAVELDIYPDTRTEPVHQAILQAHVGLEGIKVVLTKVAVLLPPDNNESGKGNPRAALELIGEINAELSVLEKALGEVESSIAKLESARRDAVPLLVEANKAIVSSEAHLQEVSRDRGYRLDGALKEAAPRLAHANEQAELGRQTLSQQPKVDFVAAFEAAQAAKDAAESAYREIDEQVSADDESARLISDLQVEIGRIQALKVKVDQDMTLLGLQHNPSVWMTVSGNALTIEVYVADAYSSMNTVQRLRLNQWFKEAAAEGHSGMSKLANARNLANAVFNVRSILEEARRRWPNEQANARAALLSAYGPVQMYDAYSMRASSLFSWAENQLNEAENAAADRRYETAVESAVSAAVNARSAAIQAQADYDAEMDRQRREREERQRREREEEAARQRRIQEELNRSFSNSSDYGGGSYGGGSYGGGSYGGGSDYGSFGGGGNDYGSFP